jgi:subtilisin-like proprotein convertase family protein
MNLIARLGAAILVVAPFVLGGITQGAGMGGAIPAGAFATSGVVTSDIVLTSPGVVASGNAVTVTLLGLQHDYAGDLHITLAYIDSNGATRQSVDLLNRVGASSTNTYGTAADFGNNQGLGDNYRFNTDYAGNLWTAAACADPPACSEPLGDADSIPGVSTDTVNNGQYFTSTTGGAKTNLSYAFAGLSVSGGTWRLTITDTADPNAGSFVGWQISVATTASSAPAVTLSSNSLTFASQTVGSSASQTITVTNSGTAALSISALQLGGSNSADFQASGCSGSVAASATCSISISFHPPAAGSRTATLSVVDNAANSPQTVALSGTGALSGTPTSFTTYFAPYGSAPPTFTGSTAVLPFRASISTGASSISSLWAYLSSASTGNLEYQIWVETYGTTNYYLHFYNGTSFPMLNPSGTTITLPTPVTLGAMQITAYRFALAGNEFQLDLTVTRSDTFNDQIIIFANSGNYGSAPWDVVDGLWHNTATNAPTVALSANSLTFASQTLGTSSSQTVTVTNSGTAALSISALPLSGTNSADFQASGCSGSVAAGASCNISVSFHPSAVGTRTATLSIVDNAANSPQTIALSGTGASSGVPTSFATYFAPYGSAPPTFTGSTVVLPFRASISTGASSISSLWAYLSSASTGNLEYQIWVETYGTSNYYLHFYNGNSYPMLNPSGTTITLPTPVTLGAMQITAYRFALAGNEFQLDLTVTRSDIFNDQIMIFANSGNYGSSPWDVVDGQWRNP